MPSFDLNSLLMIVAGVVFGGAFVPSVGKSLLGLLFPANPKTPSPILPAADSAIMYFQLLVQLMHKLLDQNAVSPVVPATPPPTATPISAPQLVAELEKLLASSRAAAASSPPAPSPPTANLNS